MLLLLLLLLVLLLLPPPCCSSNSAAAAAASTTTTTDDDDDDDDAPRCCRCRTRKAPRRAGRCCHGAEEAGQCPRERGRGAWHGGNPRGCARRSPVVVLGLRSASDGATEPSRGVSRRVVMVMVMVVCCHCGGLLLLGAASLMNSSIRTTTTLLTYCRTHSVPAVALLFKKKRHCWWCFDDDDHDGWPPDLIRFFCANRGGETDPLLFCVHRARCSRCDVSSARLRRAFIITGTTISFKNAPVYVRTYVRTRVRTYVYYTCTY